MLWNKPNGQYYDQLIALLSQKFTVQTEVKSTVNYTVETIDGVSNRQYKK
ncbi:hypothetical protein VCR8J2_360001 [Vibrio coralliirubri]|nr:hypothetical protein VCR8J2_360001 [Vibrio coralliirubri]